ncbi:hypothetical protein QJS04_geneDACA014555 [Acorus gramineus]|uniref:Uncharacterized protein n=1 Tax=Acorus gramineus TaxID=55184 RepID=A0AAV9ATW3_ACOGR|nr:hypothetical protein QJS04_geneDACA014555 [Acorus gramineus]
MATKWAQKTVVIPPQRRGCHLVTPKGKSAPWKHTLEGPDDMPAHIKSSMFGCSLTEYGCVNTGTMQLLAKSSLLSMECELNG